MNNVLRHKTSNVKVEIALFPANTKLVESNITVRQYDVK
jgi:hypothetical protein